MSLLKVFWGAVFILFNNLGWEGILISSETSHRPFEVWDWSKQAQNLIPNPFPAPGFHTSMQDASGGKTPLKWNYTNNSGGHHVAEWPKFATFTRVLSYKAEVAHAHLLPIQDLYSRLHPSIRSVVSSDLLSKPLTLWIVAATAMPTYWVVGCANSFTCNRW